jgi:predicted dehydrogenase
VDEREETPMAKKKEINIALIGHKFMGRTHSNAYRKVNFFFDLPVQVRMKVLCGIPRAEIEEIGPRYGWEEVDDNWKRVVARDDIDVVDVCTPGNLHHPMVLAAAKAGKHIICEKPLANTLKEAKEMAAAAKKARIKTMCAFCYRTAPAVTLAKQMIDEGRLGRIFHFRAAYQQDWIVDPNFPMVWRLKKKLTGSGALGDIGAHIIDMSRFLIGEIKELTATTETFIKQRPISESMDGISGKRQAKGKKMGVVDVDDAAIFLARFSNGALGTFEATRFATGCKNRHHWEIYGSKGALRWDLENLNVLWYYNMEDPDHVHGFRRILATDGVHPYYAAWWPPGHIIGYEHLFVHEVYNFLMALAKRREASPNFKDGVVCQAVLDAVERSAKSKRWVKVRI